jgi:hypothetical protein
VVSKLAKVTFWVRRAILANNAEQFLLDEQHATNINR